MPVSGEVSCGKGSLIVSQLKASNRASYEPIAAEYYQAMVNRAVGGTVHP